MHEDKFNIPAGRDPGEFLNDAELAEYHARRLADAPVDDPRLGDLQKAAQQAARGAVLTAEAQALAAARDKAELGATKKPK